MEIGKNTAFTALYDVKCLINKLHISHKAEACLQIPFLPTVAIYSHQYFNICWKICLPIVCL